MLAYDGFQDSRYKTLNTYPDIMDTQRHRKRQMALETKALSALALHANFDMLQVASEANTCY